MSKKTNNVKINLATINATTLGMFSDYHKALAELEKLSNDFRDGKKALEKERTEILAKRQEDMEKGATLEEVAVKYDLMPVDNKRRALENAYKDNCKPHKDAMKKALEVLPNAMYFSYLLASKKSNTNAKGSITLTKGKKTEEVKVEVGFKDFVRDFLVEIGASNTDNDNAIAKFVDYLVINTSGMRSVTIEKGYADDKKEVQFKKLFMSVFFKYAIIDKKVLVVNDDNTLSVRKFD